MTSVNESIVVSPDAARFVSILHSSAVLQRALPVVRKQALWHTLAAGHTVEQGCDVLLQNVAGSPYLPDDKKNILAEMVLTQQWLPLREALQCSVDVGRQAQVAPTFDTFRGMVVAIFSRSSKIGALPKDRRQALGAAIQATRSIDELKTLALVSLQNSVAFDGRARDLVANDILDDCYDLLLLPDRFDCDEQPRKTYLVQQAAAPSQQQHADVVGLDEECSVCLGASPPDTKLRCGHIFCRGCIEQWVHARHSCPLCRAPSQTPEFIPYQPL
jgi:hypothetical protein